MNMSEVTIAYGMTETSPVSFQSGTDDPMDKRVSTVGRVPPHVEVKIINDEGRAVPRGEKGELCTRGYSVMLGYWNDEDKTKESIDAGGWMHTGDLATMDDEGYVNIVGRVKDMIIRGGENVYPLEIENRIDDHPSVEEVAVVGVDHRELGQEVKAIVVPKAGKTLGEQELKDFVAETLAYYKVPTYVEIQTDPLPRNATGKVLKAVLLGEATNTFEE